MPARQAAPGEPRQQEIFRATARQPLLSRGRRRVSCCKAARPQAGRAGKTQAAGGVESNYQATTAQQRQAKDLLLRKARPHREHPSGKSEALILTQTCNSTWPEATPRTKNKEKREAIQAAAQGRVPGSAAPQRRGGSTRRGLRAAWSCNLRRGARPGRGAAPSAHGGHLLGQGAAAMPARSDGCWRRRPLGAGYSRQLKPARRLRLRSKVGASRRPATIGQLPERRTSQ